MTFCTPPPPPISHHLQGSLSGRQVSLEPGSSSKSSRSRSSASEQSTPSASPRSPCSPMSPELAAAAQSPTLDPAVQLSHQARIRHMYGGQGSRSELNAQEEGHELECSGNVDSETREAGMQRVSGADDGGDDVLESEDDAVSLTNESVSFTKKPDRTPRQVNRHENLPRAASDAESPTSRTGDETMGYPANSSGVSSPSTGRRDLVVDIKRAQNRRSTRGSSSSSSATNKTVGDNDDLEEPVTPKSVTFAEQLISEEISFDPSSPHLGEWNGEMGAELTVGSNVSNDPSGIDGDNFDSLRQQCENSEDVLDKRTSTDFGVQNRDNVRASPNKMPHSDTDGNSGSGMTASQLREHFEKMNTGDQANRPAPLPASRSSLTGRQQPGVRNAINNHVSVHTSLPSSTSTGATIPNDGSGSQPAEDLAMRVLADVATQRAAVERMQMHSIIQSQDAGRKLREEQQQQQQQKPPIPTQRQRRLSTSSQNSSLALSRDSPSSLSISSDINDSLVAPAGGAPARRVVKSDSSEMNLFNKGSQLQYGDNSFPFENNNVGPNVTMSSRHNVRTTADISHMSFSDKGGVNSMVSSHSSSPSAATVPMNTHPTSGTKGNFHSSHHQQPNAKGSGRLGPTVSSRISVHSAQSVLFPQGGRPTPPGQMSTSSVASGFSMHSSPSAQTRLSHTAGDGQHMGVGGSGENSISSDNSEGAESNLQSSASSGYHSEHSGLLRGVGVSSILSGSSGGGGRVGGGVATTALSRTQLPNEDRDLYTQEFVNRAPSFTFSSGSSSPYSRASNDEMAYPTGPDVTSNNKQSGYGLPPNYQKRSLESKKSVLTDVAFPNQTSSNLNPVTLNTGEPKYPTFHSTNGLHNMLSKKEQESTMMRQGPSPSMRKSSSVGSGFPVNNTPGAKSSFPLGSGDADGGSNSSLSSSSSSHRPGSSAAPMPMPATPLVRTNALGPSPHSRPESSNSLSSQYSTSSSTLSTIYRPLQQQQQSHKGEPGVDARASKISGLTSTRGQSPKQPVSSMTSHSSQPGYPPFPAKTQNVNTQGQNFLPDGRKEEPRLGYNNNVRQPQTIRPYRPISMNSNIGGHSNNRRSADFVDSRQANRDSNSQGNSAGQNSYHGQGYKKTQSNLMGPGNYNNSNSGGFIGARGPGKDNPNPNNNRLSMPQYASNTAAAAHHSNSYHQDSNSDSFTEDHDDYRARLADTQRNMFSKMQHPKLTNMNTAEGGHDSQRNNHGFNGAQRGNSSSQYNSRPGPENNRSLAPPTAQQAANQLQSVSSNQQTFQDPRGSVPLVLRSSKC